MKTFKLLACAVALVALAACAGTAQTRATNGLAIACDTYATALDQLTPLKAAGKLSDTTIARVDSANSLVSPLCSKDAVVDPASAVSTVQMAIALIAQVKGG